jgi:hypothetical protein
VRASILLLLGSLPLVPIPGDALLALEVEVVFAQSVDEKQPAGVDTVFASDAGRVYCWTLVTGATDSTRITHRWFYGDTEMASVDLDIGSSRWRTWSFKTIMPEWTGRWSVSVNDSGGRTLATSRFRVSPDMQQRSR